MIVVIAWNLGSARAVGVTELSEVLSEPIRVIASADTFGASELTSEL